MGQRLKEAGSGVEMLRNARNVYVFYHILGSSPTVEVVGRVMLLINLIFIVLSSSHDVVFNVWRLFIIFHLETNHLMSYHACNDERILRK